MLAVVNDDDAQTSLSRGTRGAQLCDRGRRHWAVRGRVVRRTSPAPSVRVLPLQQPGRGLPLATRRRVVDLRDGLRLDQRAPFFIGVRNRGEFDRYNIVSERDLSEGVAKLAALHATKGTLGTHSGVAEASGAR